MSGVNSLGHAGTLQWGEFFDGNFASTGINGYTDQHHTEHITVEDDPTGRNRKVLRFATHSTDTSPPVGNCRTQLGTPFLLDIDGGEFWVGFAIRLDPTFTIPPPGTWVTVHEVFGQPYAGQPPISLGVATGNGGLGGTPQLQVKLNNTYNQARPAFIACPRGQWLNLVFHIRLSTDPAKGFLEISKNTGSGWQDVMMTPPGGGTPVKRLYYATVETSINGGNDNMSQLKNYILADTFGRTLGDGSTFADPTIIWFAEHRIARSFLGAAPRLI